MSTDMRQELKELKAVTYKLVGGFALTLTYIIATVVYLAYKGFLRDEHGAAVDAGKAP